MSEPTQFVFAPEGVAAVSPRLDFFGLYRDRSALPGLDPLIDRVTRQVGQFDPAPASGPVPVPMPMPVPVAAAVTGGPAAFFGGLKLPRVVSFVRFVRDYTEQVRVARAVALPGVGTGVLEAFLPDSFEDRRGLSLFARLGHLFHRGGLGDRISVVEVGFLRTLFQLTRLDWDEIDLWGGQDDNLQQLTTYYIELFHGRFRDRNGVRIAFDSDGRFDAADLSPAAAGVMFRVFVEFLGDKLYRVPLCNPAGDPLHTFTCAKAGLIGAAVGEVRLNGTGDDYSELVTKVVGYAARRAEKSVRATVGGLIRGGGIAAINNEVVAESVSASAAGLAKKASERLTFGLLAGYITDPAVGGTVPQKTTVLALLNYLHLNVALPNGGSV